MLVVRIWGYSYECTLSNMSINISSAMFIKIQGSEDTGLLIADVTEVDWSQCSMV